MAKHKKRIALIVYIVIFYVLWAFFEFVIKDTLICIIPDETLCQFVKSGVIKNLVWTVPAFLLIWHFKSEVYITLKEMFATKVDWLKYLPILLLFAAYILTGSILRNGKIEIVNDFGIDKIIIVLFVGLTEEMVFRGWLLNATIYEEKKWIYIIINAVMFLAIHFPTWIHREIFITNFTNLGFLETIILSIIFSYTFIKSRNIFVPIILHMYWDLLVFMLI